jgi:hypothetical protein
VKSRLAVPRSTATRAPFHALVHEMKKAAHVGDHRRGGRGLDDCAVVLVGRYGCRNRQAARGPRRPWVNSPWCCLGSSPPTRERQGAKKCRKPESWWQNHEIGGGFPLMAPRKRIQGALVDGRRSASRMSLLLTRVRRNRRWFLDYLWVTRASRHDRERQRSVSRLARG